MFQKKKGAAAGAADKGGETAENFSTPPLKPFSKSGSHTPAGKRPKSGLRVQAPRRIVEIPGPGRRKDRSKPGDAESRRLLVGREIHLSGDITSCDRLVVEGHVEASLTDARLIEVASTGCFKGNAEVEEADISGVYEGELIAHDKLTVRAGGRVSGSIRYGRIVIENGGEVSGDMRSLSHADSVAAAPKRQAGGGQSVPEPVAETP